MTPSRPSSTLVPGHALPAARKTRLKDCACERMQQAEEKRTGYCEFFPEENPSRCACQSHEFASPGPRRFRCRRKREKKMISPFSPLPWTAPSCHRHCPDGRRRGTSRPSHPTRKTARIPPRRDVRHGRGQLRAAMLFMESGPAPSGGSLFEYAPTWTVGRTRPGPGPAIPPRTKPSEPPCRFHPCASAT